MKRWFIAVGLFIVFTVSLMLCGVGLYLLARSLFETVLALVLLVALAIWLSGPMSNLWKSN